MKLDVLLSGRFVGTVDLPDNGHPVLLCDAAYFAEPVATPLSSMLPVQQAPMTGPRVQHWLEGLLPDDPRVLGALLQQHRINTMMPLRLLGTAHGFDCAGAVQLCLPERTAQLLARDGGLDTLGDEEVFGWLRELADGPSISRKGFQRGSGRACRGCSRS